MGLHWVISCLLRGVISIFPGGTVLTVRRSFADLVDPGWQSFTARMIARLNATVVPIFFGGHNSWMFQIASHMHQTLQMGLLLKEFRTRIDTPVRLVIGALIARQQIQVRSKDPLALMDYLRNASDDLSPIPFGDYAYG